MNLLQFANYNEQLAAVKRDGNLLKCIFNQTDEMIKLAIDSNRSSTEKGLAFQFAKYQTEELCIYALNKNPNLIKYVRNKTKKLVAIIDKHNYQVTSAGKYGMPITMFPDNTRKKLEFNNQNTFTEEELKDIVSNDPNQLAFVVNQTNDICYAALTRDPNVIIYVTEHNFDIIDCAFRSGLLNAPGLVSKVELINWSCLTDDQIEYLKLLYGFEL